MFGFGKDKDKDDDKEEQAKLGKTIANLSDQVGGLQQQVNAKNKQIEDLMKQAQEAQSKAASGGAAAKASEETQRQSEMLLKDAQAQMRALEKQIADLAKAKNEAEAAAAAAQQAATQPAAVLGTMGAAAAATGDLAVGTTAWVHNDEGKTLRRRSAAGLEASVLDGLAVGTQLTLLEGPITDDGYTWWRIRTSDGREGWVAGEGLVTEKP